MSLCVDEHGTWIGFDVDAEGWVLFTTGEVHGGPVQSLFTEEFLSGVGEFIEVETEHAEAG